MTVGRASFARTRPSGLPTPGAVPLTGLAVRDRGPVGERVIGPGYRSAGYGRVATVPNRTGRCGRSELRCTPFGTTFLGAKGTETGGSAT